MTRDQALQLPSTGVMVMIGFAIGVFTGLFFGEMAAVLSPVGKAYIRLLQMAIVPYITVSLIHGLGRLTPQQAIRMARYGGAVLALLISLGMALTLLSPLAYPDWASATFFSSSLLAESKPVDFINLYITHNPFDALANTLVPAIVLFSIVMGVAVMLSEKKAPMLAFLGSAEDALMIISRSIVKLAPIGIFAIAANSAGTLDLSDLDRLQIFIWTHLALWIFLFFVILPGILVSISPVGYLEYFRAFRAPFVTAFVAGSFLITLPMLIEEIRRLLKHHDAADEETEAAVDVLIPTLFNFPSVAMMLLLSFVLFAGWYSGTQVSLAQYPLFASAGIFVAFAGSNVAIPFLLDMLRLPTDLFDLFLVANVINNFFFQALAASNLVVCTLLTLLFIKGRIAPRPGRLLLLAGVVVVAAPLVLKGMSVAFDKAIAYEYRGYQQFIDRKPIYGDVGHSSGDYDPGLPIPETPSSRIERITDARQIRVGYSPDSLPWAFRNNEGRVVGYDIELLGRIARDLDVTLKLIRVPVDAVHHALASEQIDIYASGMLLEPRRVEAFAVSTPYAEVTLALLVRDHERGSFEATGRFVNEEGGLIGVVNAPSIIRAMHIAAPDRRAEPVESPRPFLNGARPDIAGLVMPAETASAWTMVYPTFSVVIPENYRVKIPLVFGLASSDPEWIEFVDQSITMARSIGVNEKIYRHWILGQSVKAGDERRWSIVRDVLGWVE